MSRLDPKNKFNRPGGTPNRPETVRDVARRKNLVLPGFPGSDPIGQGVLSTAKIQRGEYEAQRANRERPRPLVQIHQFAYYDLLEVTFASGDDNVVVESEEFAEISLANYAFMVVDINFWGYNAHTGYEGDNYTTWSYSANPQFILKSSGSTLFTVSLGPISTQISATDNSPSIPSPPYDLSANISFSIPSLTDHLIWCENNSEILTDVECVGVGTASTIGIHLFRDMPGMYVANV